MKKNYMGKVRAISFALTMSMLSVCVFAEEYTLNFKDAEIKELIKFVADATGYTVIIDPKVKGKIQVISTEPVSKQELYDLFLSVLSTHGFAAVKNGNVLRIIPDKSARTSSVPVETGSARPNAEFITQIIELENVSATKLIPVLRPLVPQQGHMAAYADTNAIIISDTADNVQKIKDIIKTVDKSSHQEIEVFRLEYASADETVRVIEQLDKSGADKGAKNASTEDRLTMVADKRSNSIIVSGTHQARVRLRSLIAALDTSLESVGNAQVVFLHHASAKDLAPVLAKVSMNMAKLDSDAQAGGAKTKAGQMPAAIEADEATNSLIITAQAEVMEGLKAIIERLDIPRAQVLVEAIIVEVTQGDDKALGFDWLAANKHGGFAGSNQSNGLAGSVALGAFDDDEEKSLTGMAAAVAGVPGAIWGGADFDLNGTSFSAILTALETNGETNILSTPSLMTLDNNEATIVVGQEVPFLTGSYTTTGGGDSTNVGNPFQTIERQNVGITLTVTPHVNEGNNITLNILQEVSGLSANDQGTADVVTNERRIETTVNTGDGETIVLGGLIEDKVIEQTSKVPVLGDLPVIGRLFRRSSTQVAKVNLMVFIRPTVIRNSDKLLGVSKEKYREIRKIQRYKHARGVDLFNEDVLPLLPEWEKQLQELKRIQDEETDGSQSVPAMGVMPPPQSQPNPESIPPPLPVQQSQTGTMPPSEPSSQPVSMPSPSSPEPVLEAE